MRSGKPSCQVRKEHRNTRTVLMTFLHSTRMAYAKLHVYVALLAVIMGLLERLQLLQAHVAK